ncbi:universal stress protein [Cellulophaga sp. HaHaR_3_176]|uniref:universal stress protein n=1 Tax=Cellulophaga sp. HaHaR_3_176 TaxID=1942464 RepID=UPI001C1FDC39|nr:universal stress protein [Cellulophaga sp. HaHaR_3_176]QWX83590.1 universal stress protein [Cellulophaga sp. HaHaR_3_176]
MKEKIHPFKTILFGFAFSPKLHINIEETSRITTFFNAKLILLHVGEKTEEKINKINAIIKNIQVDNLSVEIQWKSGDPIEVITKICKTSNIDLLILGALQHENVYQFYVGSIARKLTRKVCCSVMLLIKPSLKRIACKNIVVNGLDEPDTPLAIADAFYVANALGAQQLTIVEEILQKEIQVIVEDDKSLKKANIIKERLKNREESRVRKIINNQCDEYSKNLRIKSQNIFGERGYSIGHYAEVIRADLLIMNAPKKTRLIDRIFPHDIEYILSDLPTDLLIIRRPN